MKPGYYRDHDTWLYLSSDGRLFYVSGPDVTEPAWQDVGLPLSDDSKPKTPDAEDLAAFERTRVAYGIPE